MMYGLTQVMKSFKNVLVGVVELGESHIASVYETRF